MTNRTRRYPGIFCASMLLCLGGISQAGAQDRVSGNPSMNWRVGLTGANGFIAAPLDENVPRAFSIDLDGDGLIDSVYLDRSSNKVIVCFGGAAIDCRKYANAGEDMFPRTDFAMNRDSILFAADGKSSTCVVASDRASLQCSAAETHGVFKQSAPSGSRVVLKSSAQDTSCAVLPSGLTRCTGSRRLQRGEDLIADFSGTGRLENIRIQGLPTSCALSSGQASCKFEAGLSRLTGATEWAAVQLKPHGATAIFAIKDMTLLVCARSLAQHGEFTCAAKELNADLSQLNAWVTRRFQKGETFFDGVAFVPATASTRSDAGLLDELNATVEALYDAATDSRGQAKDDLIVHEPGGGLMFPPLYYGPSNDDYWEQDCVPTSACGSQERIWSDTYGYYWLATLQRSPQACQQCAEDRADAYSYCAVAAGAMALTCAGAGVLFAASTGPIGAVGASMIIGAIGACAAGTDALCNSVADQRYAQCQMNSC